MKNGRRQAWFINGQKDEGRRAREVVDGEDLYQITHKRIYQAYEEVCDEGGLLDFGTPAGSTNCGSTMPIC